MGPIVLCDADALDEKAITGLHQHIAQLEQRVVHLEHENQQLKQENQQLRTAAPNANKAQCEPRPK